MDGLIPLSAAQRAVAEKVGAMASTPAWRRPLTPEAQGGEQAPGVMGLTGEEAAPQANLTLARIEKATAKVEGKLSAIALASDSEDEGESTVSEPSRAAASRKGSGEDSGTEGSRIVT